MLAYNIGIFAYRFFAWLFAAFNSKAKAWYIGNTTQTSVLLEPKQKKRVWFHISSLGEYEQAKPVIKGLVNNFEIVITFFSPSGYQHKSVREFTEHVFYIGIDTKTQAKNNIKNIVPDLFVLVKYDFWLNHLFQLEKENVKSIIISGLFRPKQVFFKPWGGKFRMALETFDHLFLQNQTSSDLLQSIGIDNSTVNGDTRVDSVLDNVPVAMDRLPDSIKQFAKGNKCLVVGSSYLDEEQIIADNISGCLNDWKIIIAPHNIKEKHLNQIETLFGTNATFLSKSKDNIDNTQVLVVDQIGLLKYLYTVADVAFVGGGFGKTVHNTLEPAAFGIPIIFGPNFSKFPEAVELINTGAAISISSKVQFRNLNEALNSESKRVKAGKLTLDFIHRNSNATQVIHHKIKTLISSVQ